MEVLGREMLKYWGIGVLSFWRYCGMEYEV